jgi:YD repeat-containing protein
MYSYDILGNLLTVTDSRNRVTTMTYGMVNRMATKTLPNGIKTAKTAQRAKNVQSHFKPLLAMLFTDAAAMTST